MVVKNEFEEVECEGRVGGTSGMDVVGAMMFIFSMK